MRLTVLSVFILLSLALQAQNLHVTAFGGFANYQGDLQDKRFTTEQSHAAVGAGLMYELSNHFSARLNFTTGTVSADDRFSKNFLRNLNFTSRITDYHFGVEYNLLDIYAHGFTPYVFAGISYFHFNPKASLASGERVALQPLGTEGQGFFENRKKYELSQFSIPFGGGIRLALGDNIRIGAELGLRKTGTDYLDDVSKTYADQNELASRNGPLAASIAFRGDELKTGAYAYPAAGEQRGSPKSKDWYYFTGITISYRLHNNNGNGGGSRGLGCPGGVQ